MAWRATCFICCRLLETTLSRVFHRFCLSSLSHRLWLSFPRQPHPIATDADRPSFIVCSCCSTNFEPFFLLSSRCLSFPHPPPDTRASRFVLAHKRPSLALPRPFQDFDLLDESLLSRDNSQACHSLTRCSEYSFAVPSVAADTRLLSRS